MNRVLFLLLAVVGALAALDFILRRFQAPRAASIADPAFLRSLVSNKYPLYEITDDTPSWITQDLQAGFLALVDGDCALAMVFGDNYVIRILSHGALKRLEPSGDDTLTLGLRDTTIGERSFRFAAVEHRDAVAELLKSMVE
ncbi:MAG: hypothetical protein R3D45_07780 [Rhizobiaceae bacterium]